MQCSTCENRACPLWYYEGSAGCVLHMLCVECMDAVRLCEVPVCPVPTCGEPLLDPERWVPAVAGGGAGGGVEEPPLPAEVDAVRAAAARAAGLVLQANTLLEECRGRARTVLGEIAADASLTQAKRAELEQRVASWLANGPEKVYKDAADAALVTFRVFTAFAK